MLYEEQAAELLRRCEAVAGRTLHQVRGNLRKASTRAEAVWELLVFEAASHLGKVECEPAGGGPDIRLLMRSGRWLSIEVTYLHPRFEDEERRCSLVTGWLADAERMMGPQRVAIECNFEGGTVEASGTRLTLPAEHERKRFLANPEVANFLAAVRARPNEWHRAKLADYTVTLSSRPRASDADRFTTSSRPALESPKVVSEHAAFRALRAKVEQHKVDEPYIVCIGSDVSRALTSSLSGLDIRLHDALGAAVRPSGRLSAVLTVPVQTTMPAFSGVSRHAQGTLYPVAKCRHPLSPEEVEVLGLLNLNRWKYTFPLARREPLPKHRHPKVGGRIGIGHTKRDTVKLTIPASTLVDVLAGRKALLDEYGGDDDWLDQKLKNCLREGWTVVGCKFENGNIEQAQSARVELELAPPHLAVFWGMAEKPLS